MTEPTVHDLPARFSAKVDFAGPAGCWIWTASVNHDGYGAYWSEGSMRRAHRFAYQLLVRALDDDEQLDHMCFERRCVNPEHLRPVTSKQNNEHKRGARADSKSGVRGVFWDGNTSKWRVQVGHNGGRLYGGVFTSLVEAEVEAVRLRAELFTHDDGTAIIDPPTIRDVTSPTDGATNALI